MLAIPGSVRPGSLNARLLRAAALAVEEAIAAYASLMIYPQGDLAALPPFYPDADGSDGVRGLRGAVASADAVLLATPEYNGSIPGGLKNAIDWVSVPPGDGPIRGKPAAVIGADRGEVGCDWAHADARKVLETAGARVIAAELAIAGAEEAFDSSGRLTDVGHARRLGRVLGELFTEARTP